MDHIDVEAAAVPARSTRGFAENSGAQDHDTSYSMIPTPTNDGKQHENIQRIAHAVTDRLLRCLRVLVQEELHNTEAPLELLVLASSERNALAGAPENSPESQTKLDVRQGNHDNEEERGYRPLHKQVSSGLVEAKDIATNNEDKNSHKQGKIKCNPSQNPGQSGKPVVEYTQRVMKMTQNEIETQNAHRSSFREKWRAERHLSYLEDPWKHLWRRNRTEAEPLFRRCTDDERKGLQLDLIDALYFVPKVHNFRHIPWRGLRTLSCWVSLIGLRLNEICGNSPYPFNDHASGIHSCPAFRHIQILIECIWVCNNTSLPRVGDVLIACYKRAILYQPYFGDGCNRNEASSILRIQLRLVHISIFLVNILYKHQPPGLVKDNDLEEVWLRPLSVVEQAMRHTPSSDVFDAGREPFLTVSDLNLKDLQELGKLKIQWTPYWDEHLKLESRSSMTILRLYWFPTGISEILSTW